MGKIIDDYFAKIIIIEFIFSTWGFLEAVLTPGDLLDSISFYINVFALALIGIITIFMIKNKL